jgi:hypothetical protein
MKLLIVIALAAVLCFAGYGWHAVYVRATHASEGIDHDFAEQQAKDEAKLKAINDKNDALERAIEKKEWNSPRELRDWRKQVAATLAEDLQGADAQATANEQATLARIDARLKQLKSAR